MLYDRDNCQPNGSQMRASLFIDNDALTHSSGSERIVVDYHSSSSDQSQKKRAAEFEGHASTWLKETRFVSSPSEKYLHPSYARIIGMGREALPHILGKLTTDPADWFYALRAITGANPVTDDMAGKMTQMRDAWLKWAKNRGITDGAAAKAFKAQQLLS